MKKIILSFGLLLFITGLSIAQDHDKKHDHEESRKRIEASKAAYMTTYLDLSSEEAAKFWPVYNEYQEEMKSMYKRGEQMKISEMSDAEASKRLDQHITMSSDRSNLTAKYLTKFRSILPDKKVLMLTRAEGEFKKQMVKRYANHKGKKGRPHGGDKK